MSNMPKDILMFINPFLYWILIFLNILEQTTEKLQTTDYRNNSIYTTVYIQTIISVKCMVLNIFLPINTLKYEDHILINIEWKLSHICANYKQLKWLFNLFYNILLQ